MAATNDDDVLQKLLEKPVVDKKTAPAEKGPNDTIRVLSLDGGGLKGRAIVEMLRQIENAGKSIREHFDFVVGTSTGALIAIGIVYFNYTCDEMDDLIDYVGEEVFVTNSGKVKSVLKSRSVSQSCQLLSAKGAYDTTKLESLLQGMLKEGEVDVRMNHVQDKRILITSTDEDKLFLFKNYVTAATDGNSDKPSEVYASAPLDACVWKAGRASSAAPFYFDQFDYSKTRTLRDGGMMANNPTVLAYQEARKLWSVNPLEILSLGCGWVDCFVKNDNGEYKKDDDGNFVKTSRKKYWTNVGSLTKASTSILTNVTEAHIAMKTNDSVDQNLDYYRFVPELDFAIDLASNSDTDIVDLLSAVADITGVFPVRLERIDKSFAADLQDLKDRLDPADVDTRFAEYLLRVSNSTN